MYKNLDNPSYQPRTYLMNELSANENYELVLYKDLETGEWLEPTK